MNRECRRGSVIFHPPCDAHANTVGPRGTMSLNVEITPELWAELDFVSGQVLCGDVEWLAASVWREVHLARLFRERYGYSMGEFVRRRRIAWACGQLAGSATLLPFKTARGPGPKFSDMIVSLFALILTAQQNPWVAHGGHHAGRPADGVHRAVPDGGDAEGVLWTMTR